MNEYYMSFDEADDSSKLGVTMSMAYRTDSFDANMFCAPYEHTSCYQGQADCRLSASLYNHKMLLKKGENKIKLGLERIVGYVFNQEEVEQRIGKCSSIFDAAAFNNYNGGCGTMAMSHDCSDKKSAFYNICPSTGKTCTGNDTEVTNALCAPKGPRKVPKTPDDWVCFFRGVAWDAQNLGGDDLRSMAKERLKHQDCEDPAKGPCISYWNEVIIDNRLLLPALQKDPASMLWAFTYLKAVPPAAGLARAMRDKFCDKYKCDPKTIPVIGIDDTIDFITTGGPFFEDPEVDEVQVV